MIKGIKKFISVFKKTCEVRTMVEDDVFHASKFDSFSVRILLIDPEGESTSSCLLINKLYFSKEYLRENLKEMSDHLVDRL